MSSSHLNRVIGEEDKCFDFDLPDITAEHHGLDVAVRRRGPEEDMRKRLTVHPVERTSHVPIMFSGPPQMIESLE